MPAAKKNPYAKKKRPPANKGQSTLDQGWPPAWSVSFSDLTTLLMTAFLLWYSLTAAKIPPELLAMSTKKIAVEDIEYLKKMKKSETEKEGTVMMLKKVSRRQEEAIQQIKRLKAFGKELNEYLETSDIKDSVEIKEGLEAILLTPRTPLLFNEGKDELSPRGKELLDKISRMLKEIPYYHIRIEGYTDNKPIDPFHRHKYRSNWELSYARAVSVAQYLIKDGVLPERIGVAGYGAEKPRYPNDTKENREKNRRVEIFISFAKTEGA